MASAYIDDDHPSYRYYAMSEIIINQWDDTTGGTEDCRLSYGFARLIIAIHRAVEHGNFTNREASVHVDQGWATVTQGASVYRFPIQGLANCFEGEAIERIRDDESAIENILAILDSNRQKI